MAVSEGENQDHPLLRMYSAPGTPTPTHNGWHGKHNCRTRVTRINLINWVLSEVGPELQSYAEPFRLVSANKEKKRGKSRNFTTLRTMLYFSHFSPLDLQLSSHRGGVNALTRGSCPDTDRLKTVKGRTVRV